MICHAVLPSYMHTRRAKHDANQCDYLADVPLPSVLAPVDPTDCYPSRPLSELQKSVLAHAAQAVAIYGLIDPRTGVICYIGKTKNIEARYRQHTMRGYGSRAMCDWMRDLRRHRKKPRMSILEITDQAEARWREYRWIRKYHRHINLLNTMYKNGRAKLPAPRKTSQRRIFPLDILLS